MCDFLWLFGSNIPLEPLCKEKKKNLLPHQKWQWGSNFCEPRFLDLSQKELFTQSFLHCGDELNGLGPSRMGSTHGNVIFDILEVPAFQKYSICWVFQAFFLFKWLYHVFCPFINSALNTGDASLKEQANIGLSGPICYFTAGKILLCCGVYNTIIVCCVFERLKIWRHLFQLFCKDYNEISFTTPLASWFS